MPVGIGLQASPRGEEDLTSFLLLTQQEVFKKTCKTHDFGRPSVLHGRDPRGSNHMTPGFPHLGRSTRFLPAGSACILLAPGCGRLIHALHHCRQLGQVLASSLQEHRCLIWNLRHER